MLSKKIAIPLVGICLIGVILGAYRASAAGNNAKIVNQLPAVAYQDEHIQKLSDSPKVNADIASPSKPAEQLSVDDKNESKIKELVAQGKLIEATDNGLYDSKKAVMISRERMVAVEGYRVALDQYRSYSQYKYYVIIDFSIMNGNSDYYSSLTNFVLSDFHDYTYTPTLMANTRGDIRGEMKPKDFKRGEVAFFVPGSETEFELHFNTGIEAVKTIRFKLDTDYLINPPLPNQPSPSSSPSSSQSVDDQQAPY